MTFGQRKAHKYIWIILIIVIPITMFSSIRNLDVFSSNRQEASLFEGSNEASLNTYENDIVKASIFESRMEIILKASLKNSSAVVYEIDSKGNKAAVLGQLAAVGVHRFNINNLPKGIIIYDDLKQVEITKFFFQWD